MLHEYVHQRRAVALQRLWTTPTEYSGLVAEHHLQSTVDLLQSITYRVRWTCCRASPTEYGGLVAEHHLQSTVDLLQSITYRVRWTCCRASPTEYGGLVAEHHLQSTVDLLQSITYIVRWTCCRASPPPPPHPQLVDVIASLSCQLHSSISVNIQLDYSRLMFKFIVAIWKVSSLFTIFCVYWFSTSKLSSKGVEKLLISFPYLA